MSEKVKVLDIIGTTSVPFRFLLVTPEKLIVVQPLERDLSIVTPIELPLEAPVVKRILKVIETIPNSEITKVELKKSWLSGAKIQITTTKEKYKWHIKPTTAQARTQGRFPKAKLEHYENILRPVFGDKLSVKK